MSNDISVFYPEQQKAHDDLVKSRGGLLFWKVGTGKTRVALEIFATLQKVYKWPNPCICLFVCKPKCFYDVRKEIIKIGFDVIVLENNYEVTKEVRDVMQEKPTVLLVSHAIIAKYLAYFDSNKEIKMVMLDDGYLFKNPRSEKTKAAKALTVSRRALLMSGSVMTQQDVTDIYGQAMAINQHRRIAPNVTKFTGEYFNVRMIGKEGTRQFPMYSPKPESYSKIVKALGDCVSFYFPKNEDRKIHTQIIDVPATKEQDKLFQELREWYSADAYNLELDFALQISQKVQEVSNGWIRDSDGMAHTINCNKLTRLTETVEEILSGGEQCVILCAFIQDVEVVAKSLPFATLQMSSKHDFDVKAWESGKFPVAIATEASCIGINHFEQVAYCLYYSLDWKWLDLQQSRGRFDRRSSLHTEVFYYHFHTIGGIDSRIYEVATTSGSREKALIKIGEWFKNG